MKKYLNKWKVAFVVALSLFSCNELDLVQVDNPSTSSYFATRGQFREALNEGYRPVWWKFDKSQNGIDDDFIRRAFLDAVKAGTIDSENGRALTNWTDVYKIITRMLVVVDRIEADESILGDTDKAAFRGEAYFFLGAFWSYLINHYGDVPFFEESLTIDESFVLSRTSKAEILPRIYEYFDIAIEGLPPNQDIADFVNKGTAYAFKARAALLQNDYATAATAAKGCMDLGVYDLHANFADLFKSSTVNSDEIIFQLPNSVDFDQFNGNTKDFIPRNFGGFCARNPSWELLATFECTDGLPIDESPLFDPQNPFKNRDPRCAMTIVPFGSLEDGDGLGPDAGSNFNGIEYTPHPLRREVLDYSTGNMRVNNDTRSRQNFASFNGLAWKKGIDEDWVDDLAEDSNDIWMRYAEVLLTYAEAKIELNQIDASVLKAINDVKERAYRGTGKSAPLVTSTNQAELRLKVRNERRMEFANEGIRYMDLIRWRFAEKVFATGIIGQLNVTRSANPGGPLMDNLVNPGLYFWGQTPEIDEDGLPDFSGLLENDFCRILADTEFPEKQYLWPIPSAEREKNDNLSQNEGY
ncbi:RagB/SusD family nutrient uptake outer membrane protein [uncultured Algibacter sp.]|uniref:RagB/SusD family nutrient uptake outer membrane protein n=1 Tax=uncultured Algibacter sp. TaxID=298659 RepID=UPI002605F6B6|nr:RagB/SusD family nutrient uptake outer membrane protein [uncultured Algibacter sp.]